MFVNPRLSLVLKHPVLEHFGDSMSKNAKFINLYRNWNNHSSFSERVQTNKTNKIACPTNLLWFSLNLTPFIVYFVAPLLLGEFHYMRRHTNFSRD